MSLKSVLAFENYRSLALEELEILYGDIYMTKDGKRLEVFSTKVGDKLTWKRQRSKVKSNG